MSAHDAERLYEEGRLDEAIAVLGDSLREDPSDGRARMFLVELLCFAGAWERARRLIEGLALADPEALLGMRAFQQALTALEERRDMFRNGKLPESEDEEDTPIRGTWNGEPFEDLRDADPRIGTRFEAIINGAYVWVPMHHVARLSAEAPTRLRDLFWINTEMEGALSVGGQMNAIVLPAMTVGADAHANDEVRLGRVTEWEELESGDVVPVGQKLLLVDDREVSLLEMRELVITQPDD